MDFQPVDLWNSISTTNQTEAKFKARCHCAVNISIPPAKKTNSADAKKYVQR